ncbi:MAG: DEAD/DEAH box helicase [Bacteroidota bacterium]
MTFKELALNEQLLEGLDAMGFETATPIQEKAIPVILEGKDLIACAQTGTGKTAAFLLPTLHHLTGTESDSIDTLILVPTRELAIQIDQQLEGFAYFTGVTSLPIYGGRSGESFNQEKKALTTGANIVVATPGRLIAHLNLGYVKIDKLKHLILDEADRMLDMGFVNDLLKIVSFLPENRQTLMFSATMPPKIRKFASRILKKPEQISFAVSKPAEKIMQIAYLIEDELKPKLLQHLLGKRKGKDERIIIFSSTKSNVDNIARALRATGMTVGQIHSDFEQSEREETLRLFKNGKLQVLVATDILSRGIDVKGINLVINNSVPSDAEDYIHRIGRTARADADGIAITLISYKDRRKFKDIERLMEREVLKSPLPPKIQELADKLPKRSSKSGRGGSGRGRGNSRNKSGNRSNSSRKSNSSKRKSSNRNRS